MHKAALRVVQLGAVAVVLAASTHRQFDLDRFFVPKELVLHMTAVIAGLLMLRSLRQLAVTKVDVALAVYLLLSAIAALFATNHWLAIRALAVSASGILLYWVARALRDAGLAQPLLSGIALAVVVAAAMSLVQAYGGWIELFSTNRAPGGTLGNRNFVAHAAAFGLPVVLLSGLRASTKLGYLCASLGAAAVTASLVLTRSRAAWLAFAAMLLVFLIRNVSLRLLGVFLLMGGGVAAALLLPNELRWRSDNPYLESAKGVINYEEGSGRGRLIQYQRSLVMAARSPIVGVGPGNWAVEYPDYATRNDPSIDPSARGMTFNPWPSSDWVAFIAERGLLAALVLGFAFLLMLLRWDDAAATLVAVGVAGAFDAVLLLAVPTLLVWPVLGACGAAGFSPPDDQTVRRAEARRSTGTVAIVLIVVCILGAVRSGAQLIAMEIFSARSDRASLERAALIDPGNFRLRVRLSRMGKRKDRCEHAEAARRLYPHAGIKLPCS